MRRYVGRLLIGTGVLHGALGIAGFHDTLAELYRDGYLNAVGRDPKRHAAFWFLTTGGLLIALGQLAHSTQTRTGDVPPSLGWSLLAISVPGVVLMPASGFWLVLGQALLVLLGSRPKQDAQVLAQPASHIGVTTTPRRT